MALPTLLVPAIQVIAVTATGMISGLIGSASLTSASILVLAPPNVAVQQWKALYNRGKANMPPLAITCSLCYAFLAYTSRHASHVMQLYTAAAVCVPLIVPYTLLRMEPAVNRPLMEMAALAEKGAEVNVSEEELGGIMGRWARMNLVRAGSVGLSTVFGVVATVAFWQGQ